MPVVQAYRYRRVLLSGRFCGIVIRSIKFNINQDPTYQRVEGSLPVIAQSRVRAWLQCEEKNHPGLKSLLASSLLAIAVRSSIFMYA